MQRRCSDCECWEPTGDGKGICRAVPPHPQVVFKPKGTPGDFVLVWPETNRGEWCHYAYREPIDSGYGSK